MGRGVLHVGFDDSNHSGDARGEINVAVFSYNPEDGIVTKFKNVRDYQKSRAWLEEPCKERDYRFAILQEDEYRFVNSNLPFTAPYLVRDFLKDKVPARIIYLHFDGFITKEQRDELKKEFSYVENVFIRYFLKKHRAPEGRTKRISKRPECPRVVYVADILSSRLFGSGLEELLIERKDKLVIIPAPKTA